MSITGPGADEPRVRGNRDPQMEAEVRRAFGSKLELQTHPITVEAREGEVRLEGTVPSAELRHLASQLAASAPGVRTVRNHIVVAGERD